MKLFFIVFAVLFVWYCQAQSNSYENGYVEAYMTQDNTQKPQQPNMSSAYAIHSFLYPNFALPQVCYPALVLVQNSTSQPEIMDGQWYFQYLFTLIWQDTEACEYISQYEEYVNVTYNGSGVYYFNGYNISGSWISSNDTLALFTYIYEENYDDYYQYNISLTPSAPLPPAISGQWYLSTYLDPINYQSQYCYPLSLQIGNSNSTPTFYDDEWYYNFEFEWQFPCDETCQNDGFCGSLYQEVNVTANSANNTAEFIYEQYYTIFNGIWYAANNTFNIEISPFGADYYLFAVVQGNASSYRY